MEHDGMDGFETELREALERRPAPPCLKRKLMERRGLLRMKRRPSRMFVWQSLAATLALGAVLTGTADWQLHKAEQRRQGEAARQQVMTALRITGHALDEVNVRLTAHDRDGND